MFELKENFRMLGYKFCKDTKDYIEFKTSEYGMWDRIKVYKKDYSITKDCKTGQGNRGHRKIEYKELLLILELIKVLKEK